MRAAYSPLSKDNPYWLPKNRYYELKYFCLQFDDWKKRKAAIDGLATMKHRSPTEYEAIERIALEENIKIVEHSIRLTVGDVLGIEKPLLDGVTKGKSYDSMKAKNHIPCCREAYYRYYRKFFWVLDSLTNGKP